MQMIVKIAMEPEWESKFEPNSYGFRPGRRTMDAIMQIRTTIMRNSTRDGSQWILDADIAKCFDNINHRALLDRIQVFKQAIRRWLKIGIIEFGSWHETVAGTPQGGIISPLLANIALDGLERLFGMETAKGKYIFPSKRRGKNRGVSVIRYADDFVIVAPSREIISNHVLPATRRFLAERGMTLNDAKTRIIHRSEGLNFLGFNVRQRKNHNAPCIVTPSKEAVHRLLDKIKDVLTTYKQATVNDIILTLNPLLRGWGNYYRFCNAKGTFTYVDHRTWEMIWRWCVRRHPAKGKHWIKKRYFLKSNRRDWIFGEQEDHVLFRVATIHVSIKGYTKVKGSNSPFDPMLHNYWERREGSGGNES